MLFAGTDLKLLSCPKKAEFSNSNLPCLGMVNIKQNSRGQGLRRSHCYRSIVVSENRFSCGDSPHVEHTVPFASEPYLGEPSPLFRFPIITRLLWPK
jgi:hypothetical protein